MEEERRYIRIKFGIRIGSTEVAREYLVGRVDKEELFEYEGQEMTVEEICHSDPRVAQLLGSYMEAHIITVEELQYKIKDHERNEEEYVTRLQTLIKTIEQKELLLKEQEQKLLEVQNKWSACRQNVSTLKNRLSMLLEERRQNEEKFKQMIVERDDKLTYCRTAIQQLEERNEQQDRQRHELETQFEKQSHELLTCQKQLSANQCDMQQLVQQKEKITALEQKIHVLNAQFLSSEDRHAKELKELEAEGYEKGRKESAVTLQAQAEKIAELSAIVKDCENRYANEMMQHDKASEAKWGSQLKPLQMELEKVQLQLKDYQVITSEASQTIHEKDNRIQELETLLTTVQNAFSLNQQETGALNKKLQEAEERKASISHDLSTCRSTIEIYIADHFKEVELSESTLQSSKTIMNGVSSFFKSQTNQMKNAMNKHMYGYFFCRNRNRNHDIPMNYRIAAIETYAHDVAPEDILALYDACGDGTEGIIVTFKAIYICDGTNQCCLPICKSLHLDVEDKSPDGKNQVCISFKGNILSVFPLRMKERIQLFCDYCNDLCSVLFAESSFIAQFAPAHYMINDEACLVELMHGLFSH